MNRNEVTDVASQRKDMVLETRSTSSGETEGPDPQSPESSETEGPDSDPNISDEDGKVIHDASRRGMVITLGNTVSFVADNLNEQIKSSSPAASRTSRRSSFSSSADFSPVNLKLVTDLESQTKLLANSVDKMLENIQSSLHKMSAITVGCMQTYRSSVEKALSEVESNIKLMYIFMAKCEEIHYNMRDLHLINDQINDIKRILESFEADLHLSARN